MRNDELYIDGHLVDMDDDTKVTLNYKSNIFTDLSKIVSNNSYTIKLPNTVHNQCVIDHADLPTRVTEFPRVRHAARYIRNGVEVINKANAVLMSVTSTFDVALSWGNATAFAPIVNQGKKLTELTHAQGEVYEGSDYVEWKRWSTPGWPYPFVDYGFHDGDAQVWYHPARKVVWVIEQIEKEYGVKFEFPESRKTFLDKLFVPCLSRNDSEAYASKNAITFNLNSVVYDDYVSRYVMLFDVNNDSNYYGRAGKIGPYNNDKTNAYTSFIANGKPKITGHVEVVITANAIPPSPSILVYKWNTSSSGGNVDSGEVLSIAVKEIKPVDGTTNKFRAVFDFEGEEASVLKNIYQGYSNMKFSFDGLNGGTIGTGDVTGTITVVNMAEEMILGSRYFFIPNLPDMKQIDFIKAIASILGVFAVPAADNSERIRFVSIDDVIGNIPIAVDWTRKVVASYKDNKPGEITFTLDGFAQRNHFRWKEDSDVTGSYDGVAVVEDFTLETDADAITLPFAATTMSAGVAKIPLYSYDNDATLNYTSAQPRILLLDGDRGTFNGLSWGTLLSQHYASYQKIIRRPVIIKEKIELREIELKRLDMTIPVYLAQYGKYYAIISVKAENTGICECQLLQL